MLSGTSSVDWQFLLGPLRFGWAKTLAEISELWEKLGWVTWRKRDVAKRKWERCKQRWADEVEFGLKDAYVVSRWQVRPGESRPGWCSAGLSSFGQAVRALNWVNRIGTVSGAHIIPTSCVHCSVVLLPRVVEALEDTLSSRKSETTWQSSLDCYFIGANRQPSRINWSRTFFSSTISN